MTGLLDRRIALVTGGMRGLGRAIATAFAEAGATGIVLDQAAAVVSDAAPSGFDAVAGDVTREDDLAATMRQIMDRYGRLDVVVANAGLVPAWRETAALDLDEWDRVMAVNVRGVAATLKHAAPAMAPHGGSIIAMASINAFVAHAQQMAYTASKHAVLGMVRAAARDLGRHNIRVNALAPGPIATEALLERIRLRARTGPSEAEALDGLARGTALGRLATADEVAKAALFLASDLSSGITGVLLPVDAGLL